MTYPHDCFAFGALAGFGLAAVLAALFGWAFIAVTEGWPVTVGRVVAGWRRR